MSSRKTKVLICVLALLSAPGLLLSGSCLYNQFWLQWAMRSGWTAWGLGLVHSALFPLVLLIILSNFIFVLVIGGWWMLSRKTPGFPHRFFAVWFLLLLAGALSWLPSNSQYAAVAVALFGPGEKSLEFQQDAARTDSMLLLHALVLRGAKIDERLMCVAARSPRVVNYLVQRHMSVNVDCGYVRADGMHLYKSTPLHNAVSGKKHRAAQALLNAGAKVDERDYKGRTPADIAVEQGDEQMIRLLKQ